jgi:uncharacterized protein (UPF0332 family)
MIDEQARSLSGYRLNKAKTLLTQAELLLTNHQYFDRYFVKTGIFEKKFSVIIHTAFDTRQDNDYEDFYVPSKDEAQEQYDNAILLLKEIELKRELFIQEKLSLPSISR